MTPPRRRSRGRTLTILVCSLALLGAPAAAHAAPGAARPDVRLAAVSPTAIEAAVPRAAARTSVSLRLSQKKIRKAERIWFAGRVSGPSAGGRKVVLERRKVGTKTWKAYTSTRTKSSGRFSGTVRPSAQFHYRVRVVANGTTVRSKTQTVRFTKGTRTIASRAKTIASSRLGKARTGTTSLTAKQRAATKAKSVTKVRHKRYSKGILVEVTKKGTTRTWFVTGKISRAYLAAGGPTGRYGVPIADAKCGLLESGCVQRFTRGTLYSSSAKKKAVGTTTTGRRGEVIATARSQVGYTYKYKDSGSQSTKFNRWMGTTRAWCSFFLSWSSSASGNGGTIPKINKFSAFKSHVNRTMPTGSTPKVGALVFFNTYGPSGVATHVGLVVDVKRSTIRVVDGNTVGNLPASTRGILERDWPRSRALYYAYPSY